MQGLVPGAEVIHSRGKIKSSVGLDEPIPACLRSRILPMKSWLWHVVLGWLVPGGGHLLLGRRWRGALLFFSVATMYLFGLMMRGTVFVPKSGDLMATLIHTGGFVCDLLSGLPYLLSVGFGYEGTSSPGLGFDYGTVFLASAGLLNVLAMVDAYEIATGKKD